MHNNHPVAEVLRNRRRIQAPDEAQANLGEYCQTVLPLPDPLFDLDRIVAYTGSVRGAWGDYVIVSMEQDGTYTLTPLHRADLPNVHWLRNVREQSITPKIGFDGWALEWTFDVDLSDDDVERIRWWISYYRPQVMHHECLDCLGHPDH